MSHTSKRTLAPVVVLAVLALAALAATRAPAAAQSPTPRTFLFAVGAAPRAPVSGLDAPRGVALAPDGGLFVADTGHDRIIRLAPGERFERAWGESGEGEGQLASPSGIAIAPDGGV